MLRSSHVLLTCLLASVCAGGDPADAAGEIERLCRTTLCRPARAVRLNLPGGRRFETEAPRTPILFGSGFTILAGETVMVEGVIRDNALVDLVAVPEVTHP